MELNKNEYRLTPKEIAVIKLLSIGKLYKEIASIQEIKIDTVKKHATSIYKKLSVRNKTEALNKFSGISPQGNSGY